MNRIYRLVFNTSLGLIQVASELGGHPGKQANRRRTSSPGTSLLTKKTPIAAALALVLPLLYVAPTQAATTLGAVTGASGGNATSASSSSDVAGTGGAGSATNASYANQGGNGGSTYTNYTDPGYGGDGYGRGGWGGLVVKNYKGTYYAGGGGGGGGGVGHLLGSGSYTVASGTVIRGGAGGAGGAGESGSRYSGSGGYGGYGGTGIYGRYGGGSFTLSNAGTIYGGLGGAGGNPSYQSYYHGSYYAGRNGYGGEAVAGYGITLTNTGKIYGGNAGQNSSAYPGMGGAGVDAFGKSTVTNSGVIGGGTAVGLYGNTHRTAVSFYGGGNTLIVVSGATFQGDVSSYSVRTGTVGGDTLELAGSTNSTLAGTFSSSASSSFSGNPVFGGFQTLLKSGSSNWTITNGSSGNAIPNWDVEAGTLTLSSGDTFTASASTDTLTFGIQPTGTTGTSPGIDNGTIVVPGTVTFNGEGITVNLAAGTYTSGAVYTLMTGYSFDATPALTVSGIPSGMTCTDSISSVTSLTFTCTSSSGSSGTIGTSGGSTGGGGAFGFLSLAGLLGLAGMGTRNRKTYTRH